LESSDHSDQQMIDNDRPGDAFNDVSPAIPRFEPEWAIGSAAVAPHIRE
jgi:hypothetical protein